MGSARGQSETLDTLALIAVVVSLSLVIGTGVLADVDTTSEPLLDVSLDATESDVTISHAGGDSINTTVATVVLRGDGNQSRFRMDNATISGDGDGEFEVGEELTHGQNVSNSTVRVVIVHEPTNSILVDKTVDVTQPPPSAVVIAGNQAPTAAFTYSPSPPTSNQELTFDASSSSDADGTITAYEWDWTSDGTYEATGETANHTYDSTGTYNVTLRTTDDNGETDTSTVELSLTSIAPTALFSYSPATPGTDQTITFDASASFDDDGSITSYEWDWTSDGTYEATGETATHSYGTTGTYTVTLRVTDNEGLTDTTTAVITVNLNDAPTAEFTYNPSNPSKDQSIDFDASSSSDPDGTISSYQWDWTSDGTFDATGETATHTYSTNGTYTVTLRVTDNVGGWDEASKNVTVSKSGNEPPIALFDVVADDWYSSSWSYRKPIELDHRQVASKQTDFPVLIDITDTDLKHDAQKDADDVLFTTGNGTTKLDHEIESYDSSSGELVAWVKVPAVNASAPNTTIYMYYGDDNAPNQEDPDGVWDADYSGVWHFDESGAETNRSDSSGNRNDAEPQMFDNDEDVTGQVGTADNLNGDDEYLTVPDSGSLEMSDSNVVSVEAWVKKDAAQSGWIAIAQKSDTSYNLQFDNGNEPEFTIYTGGVWTEADSAISVSTDQWYHLVGTYDGSTIRIYVNGELKDSQTTTGMASADGWDIGFGENLEASGRHLDGSIDEFRISTKGRSAGWVSTTYNATGDAENFTDVGSEQTPYPVSVDAADSSDPDGTITAYDWDWTDDGTYDSSGETATHTYGATGTYTIELRTTDNESATNTTTQQVSLSEGNAKPNASFSYSPDDPDSGENVSFDGTRSSDPDGSISTYEWDFTDDGTWDATGATPTHEYADNGTYTVELRVTDDGGKTETTTRTISVSSTTFVEETSSANLGSSPGGGAIVFADFDEDGYLDIFMNDNGYNSDDVLLRENDGDLTFKDRDNKISVDGGRGAGAGDFDDDGDTDLIIGVDQQLYENDGNFKFSDSTAGSVNNEEALMFADIDGDGDLDIWSPGEDYLWHENTESGWTSHDSMPGDGVDRTANGEGATAADINNDGYIDFIWSQDDDDVDVFLNDGDYTYTHHWNVDADFGLPEDVGNHENMEWAWGDYDSDGDMDVYISGHDNEGLYRNDGTGTFTEVTSSADISESDPDGAAWGDYDNDGHLDLLLADSDGNSDLYNNDGDGTFTEVDASANLDADGALGSTVGWFDADNDGDLDIITNDKLTLWKNTRNDGEYLRVIAEGTSSPKTPIGAQIDLYDADTGTLVGHRELIASQNQLQPPLRQHFGVEPNSSYDIRVRFPSGTVAWKNDTVPSEESISIGGNTLDNTVRISEPGPLFEDDFDRADSNTLGFGWKAYEVENNDARIANNRLDFEPDNYGERPSIRNTFDEQTSGTITLNFTFNFERTNNEQYYSANIQLGDGSTMTDPQSDHDQGVAVNLKWGGNDGDIADMDDEEGFGYSVDGSDTQIGVVSGADGDNSGGDATVTVTVDLDKNEYDITVSGPGLVSGSGTATDVSFDNNVDIDTVRVFLDEVEPANFGDLEMDDIEVKQGD